jgi:Ras-related protein Rab-2A
VDLENRREVSYEEGSIYAQKNGMLFFETSAKTGKNIEEIFIKSSNEIAKKIESGFYDLTNDSCGIKQGFNTETITLNANKNENEQGYGLCCI